MVHLLPHPLRHLALVGTPRETREAPLYLLAVVDCLVKSPVRPRAPPLVVDCSVAKLLLLLLPVALLAVALLAVACSVLSLLPLQRVVLCLVNQLLQQDRRRLRLRLHLLLPDCLVNLSLLLPVVVGCSVLSQLDKNSLLPAVVGCLVLSQLDKNSRLPVGCSGRNPQLLPPDL